MLPNVLNSTGLLAFTIGIGYSVLVPIWPLLRIPHYLWLKILHDKKIDARYTYADRRKDLPCILGVIERMLYLLSMLYGHPEFVALWLGLKSAGQWKSWSKGETYPISSTNKQPATETINGRSIASIFFIGSGLSLLFSAGGFLLATGWDCQRVDAITVAAGILILTSLIHLFLFARFKRYDP